MLGQGTFGIAFLAREWDTSEPVTDPEQYAIKAQPHQTVIIEFLEWQEKLSYPDMVSFIEPTVTDSLVSTRSTPTVCNGPW